MNDYELKQLFTQNQPALPDDPAFQREVWHRIAQGGNEGISFSSLFKTLTDFLTRPTVGVPLAVSCVALAAILGFLNGNATQEQVWLELSFNYNELINPLSHHR